MGDYNKPRVYTSEILKDMISKITPEELELTEIEMMNMVEKTEQKDDFCYYSGLPSPSAYVNEENDWEEILFDFIDVYPCILPNELFEWLDNNYEIPKKKNG